MQLFLAILGGLGIGSLLHQFVMHVITRRASVSDRLYQEKREAYLGLLNALHRSEMQPDPLSSAEYVRWQTQCALFGSTEVMIAAQRMVELKDAPASQRDAAFHKLVREMRVDLGQSAPPVEPV